VPVFLLLLVGSLLVLSVTYYPYIALRVYARTRMLLHFFLMDMVFQRGQESHPVYRPDRYFYLPLYKTHILLESFSTGPLR